MYFHSVEQYIESEGYTKAQLEQTIGGYSTSQWQYSGPFFFFSLIKNNQWKVFVSHQVLD